MTTRTPKPESVDGPGADPVEIVHTEEVTDESVPALADAMATPPVDPAPELEDDVEPPVNRAETWPHEAMVDYHVPHVARGKIATQLLDAADELGYPAVAIRSQTDGFLVPSLVYYHLFPSEVPTPDISDTE